MKNYPRGINRRHEVDSLIRDLVDAKTVTTEILEPKDNFTSQDTANIRSAISDKDRVKGFLGK